jgi:hypothetical protein
MITRKATVVIFLIFLCCFLAGCSAVNKASEAPIINQFKKAIMQMKPGTEGHFIACADAYQSETGVDPKAWGTEGDDYLRQLIIKYKLDELEIKLEPDHLKEMFLLLAKLYLLNQISR